MRKGPYGLISLFERDEVLPDEKFHGDLEAAFVAPAQREGFAFVRERQFRVADTTARCFEFERKGERPEYAVRCALQESTLWPWYKGAQKYVPDFYALVAGMNRN